jgi:hypothetical protein
VLVAVNAGSTMPRRALVTIEDNLHCNRAPMKYLFRSDGIKKPKVPIIEKEGGLCVEVEVPPHGIVILK